MAATESTTTSGSGSSSSSSTDSGPGDGPLDALLTAIGWLPGRQGVPSGAALATFPAAPPTPAAAPAAPAAPPAAAKPSGSPVVGRVAAGEPRVRLICLPQAGGSAGTFSSWRGHLPPGFELAAVDLPGRGTRGAEPLPAGLGALADRLADALAPELGMPYALFGHSLGALVAYELAVRIERRGLRPPLALLVSASRAPHVPVTARVSGRDDQALLAWLTAIGGIPQDLLRYPAYLRHALRVIRADLGLAERYHAPDPVRVRTPLHVFGGTEDQLVPADQLARWSACAAGEHTLTLLPGGHSYPYTGAPAVLAALAALPALAQENPQKEAVR
ncbi:alpha/beta fold hydrolase [Streptomyces nondiastaticus]|uniref:thioesterase II family protein n=1 Tax=Streptomyces nondiastaticus TaxID=3154512 RepID=UPI00341A4F1A